MKYTVFIMKREFYKYEVMAETKKEAEFIAKKFFSIKGQREGHYMEEDYVIYKIIRGE